MLRPRESRDLRLISCDIVVTPAAVTTWAQDVFGNAVATATFKTMADTLLINSVAEVGLTAAAWPVFDIAVSAIFYPFRNSDDEWVDLVAGLGTGIRPLRSDGHAFPAQRSQRGRL